MYKFTNGHLLPYNLTSSTSTLEYLLTPFDHWLPPDPHWPRVMATDPTPTCKCSSFASAEEWDATRSSYLYGENIIFFCTFCVIQYTCVFIDDLRKSSFELEFKTMSQFKKYIYIKSAEACWKLKFLYFVKLTRTNQIYLRHLICIFDEPHGTF